MGDADVVLNDATKTVREPMHPYRTSGGSRRRGNRHRSEGASSPNASLRMIRGIVVGATVAAVVILGRQSTVLDGRMGLLLAALLALAVPTSRLLSRRILLTGSLALGWIPVTWWWDLPTGGLGRVTLLLALVAGGLAGWVSMATRPRDRVRRLIPQVAWADAIPLGGLGMSVAMLSPWLRVRSGESALAMLTLGWDHSAHYDMTEMIRVHGVVVGGAGAPSGGGAWSYAHYPQGFHAATAAIMELAGSASVGTPGQELALYARSMGLVSAMAVVVVVSGIAALPALRRHPFAAATVAGVVASAFLWGPGGLILADGFPNFFFACALLAAVPLIAIPIARWSAPLPIAALAGAVVGVAHSWALLLTLALPIVLVVLLPIRRARARASRGRWMILGLVVLATGSSIFVAIAVIRVQPLTEILTLGGGVTNRSLSELYVVVALAFWAVLMLASLARRPWSSEARRTVWTFVGPAVGGAFALWIALVQRGEGDLGYYFWKYAIALELTSIVIGAVAVGMIAARAPGIADSRLRGLALVVSVVVAVTAAFGAPHPAIAAHSLLPDSSGLVGHDRLASASLAPLPAITELLAASSNAPAEPRRSLYLPIGNKGWPNPASIGQWYEALAGTWTDDMNAPIGMILNTDLSPAGAPALARRVLGGDADLTVVVAPEYVAAVRAGLDVDDRGRVLTW